jgi:hypothetical protein
MAVTLMGWIIVPTRGWLLVGGHGSVKPTIAGVMLAIKLKRLMIINVPIAVAAVHSQPLTPHVAPLHAQPLLLAVRHVLVRPFLPGIVIAAVLLITGIL